MFQSFHNARYHGSGHLGHSGSSWGLAGADLVEVKLGLGVWEAGEAQKRLLPRDGVFGGLFELGNWPRSV